MPELRFLADESCDYRVVRALRGAGFDVSAVSEQKTRSIDRELIAQADSEQRILLTEDKDFGWLVFVSAVQSPGVILIRFPQPARSQLPGVIVDLVKSRMEQLHNRFVVVQPGYIRIRRQPN